MFSRESLGYGIRNHPGLDDYTNLRNAGRLHFSPDIASHETPLAAFRKRKAAYEARRQNDG